MENDTQTTDTQVTPAEALGRIVHDTASDAREILATQEALREALFTLLAWTKPTGEVDTDEVLAAFSETAKIVVRIGYHASEREQLVDRATVTAFWDREHDPEHATTEER